MPADHPSSDAVIIIPAFNEADSIARVIDDLSPLGRILVIDDASSDLTADIARAKGAAVISHRNNQGYEAALETGCQEALRMGAEYIISADADGQHTKEAVDRVLRSLRRGSDIVIGIRSSKQRAAETLAGIVGRVMWNVADPFSGLKGYHAPMVRKIAVFDRYKSVGTELFVRALRARSSMTTEKIVCPLRQGESRFGRNISANMKLLRAVGVLLLIHIGVLD